MILVAVVAALAAGVCFGRCVALGVFDGVWVLFGLSAFVMVLALAAIATWRRIPADPRPVRSRLDREDRPRCPVDHSLDNSD
ncbi:MULTISPECIES: hypothetical protein [unclassified Microbacterium]|uniref:hypothetical protein n=1 Tax=Microbacterium TaxID=33882 RepID=UPI003BA00300